MRGAFRAVADGGNLYVDGRAGRLLDQCRKLDGGRRRGDRAAGADRYGRCGEFNDGRRGGRRRLRRMRGCNGNRPLGASFHCRIDRFGGRCVAVYVWHGGRPGAALRVRRLSDDFLRRRPDADLPRVGHWNGHHDWNACPDRTQRQRPGTGLQQIRLSDQRGGSQFVGRSAGQVPRRRTAAFHPEVDEPQRLAAEVRFQRHGPRHARRESEWHAWRELQA